jgi:hypothetical protein
LRTWSAGELAAKRLTLDGEGHLLRQVALGHRGDDAGHLRGGADEVVHEAVDGAERPGPAALHAVERRALGHAAVAADDLRHPRELGGQEGVAGHERVERRGGLAGGAGALVGHPDREVAGGGGPQGVAQGLHGRLTARLVVVRACRPGGGELRHVGPQRSCGRAGPTLPHPPQNGDGAACSAAP